MKTIPGGAESGRRRSALRHRRIPCRGGSRLFRSLRNRDPMTYNHPIHVTRIAESVAGGLATGANGAVWNREAKVGSSPASDHVRSRPGSSESKATTIRDRLIRGAAGGQIIDGDSGPCVGVNR